MKNIFAAHFRPTDDDLSNLWENAVFSIDANVVLNLYRYSQDTREQLEKALTTISDRIFITNQAAKEFLANRLGVTSSQAKEYTIASKDLKSILDRLSDKKRHPYISEESLPDLNKHIDSIQEQLDKEHKELLDRLVDDKRLAFIENLFEGKTCESLGDERIAEICKDGEQRYENKTPPGYKDSSKDSDHDSSRKFGDLIVWFELIEYAKKNRKSLIFITDDNKEDWWQKEAGRTIGPRPELREEFIQKSNEDFWVYSVDSFLERAAKSRNETISDEVLAEIESIRAEDRSAIHTEYPSRFEGFRKITEEEMIDRIKGSENWATRNGKVLWLHSFVQNYLGNGDYDYQTSYQVIEELERKGVIEFFDDYPEGATSKMKAFRVKQDVGLQYKPFENDIFREQSTSDATK